jgi:hypothetical protein
VISSGDHRTDGGATLGALPQQACFVVTPYAMTRPLRFRRRHLRRSY